MLELGDPRWDELKSGYHLAYDPRSALDLLKSDSAAAWSELWEELHHQGDVDTASYASVPHIVHIYENGNEPDWNVYALVGVVALSLGGQNPEVPEWLDQDFRSAVNHLAEIGTQEILTASDPVLIQSILGVIALAKGHKSTGRMLLAYEENEISELFSE